MRTTALITDMDAVLGRTVGNALEVAETVDYLAGRARDPRLHEVVLALAAEMLLLGHLAATPAEARAKAQARLDDGSAAETFARMVAALDGPSDFLERHASYLPRAGVIKPCVGGGERLHRGDGNPRDRHHGDQSRRRAAARERSDRSGGRASARCAGSERRIAAGEPLAMVHAASEADADAAIAALRRMIRIADAPPALQPVVRARIGAPDVEKVA